MQWYTFVVRREFMRGYSPILTTAALSVAVLTAAFGMQLGNTFQEVDPVTQMNRAPVEMPEYFALEDADGNGIEDWQDELQKAGLAIGAKDARASSTLEITADPLASIAEGVAQSLYGGYMSLKEYGQYTPERGERLGTSVAESIQAPKTFVPHTVSELTLSEDTSKERALSYRADMRTALAPMVTNELPEIELFARYLTTKDESWLRAIDAAAARYREVEKNMLALAIPKDAAPEHLRAGNAVGFYADTLERLSKFGGESLASVALLKTYNEAERDMISSFDVLSRYYVRKITN